VICIVSGRNRTSEQIENITAIVSIVTNGCRIVCFAHSGGFCG
jgi:hypothetical protein